MNKLLKFINSMSHEDMLNLQKDLQVGNLQKIIHQRIQSTKNNSNLVCPVCSAKTSSQELTLIFGPKDFRKKAVFDAADCLQYFVEKHLKT